MPGTALRGGDRAMNTIYVNRASAPKALSLKVLFGLVNTENPWFQFIPDSPTHLLVKTTRTMKPTETIFIQVSNTKGKNSTKYVHPNTPTQKAKSNE